MQTVEVNRYLLEKRNIYVECPEKAFHTRKAQTFVMGIKGYPFPTPNLLKDEFPPPKMTRVVSS
jgi:hypothetical protein